MLLQRLEQRVAVQRLAAGGDVRRETPRRARRPRRDGARGNAVEQLEHRSLRRGDAGVVDERRTAQRGKRRLELGRRDQRARARRIRRESAIASTSR